MPHITSHEHDPDALASEHPRLPPEIVSARREERETYKIMQDQKEALKLARETWEASTQRLGQLIDEASDDNLFNADVA